MSTIANDIFKTVLCLIISVLMTFTEMQFFGNIEIFSPLFLILLSFTVPTIYLYFLPKQDSVLIFIFNIVLVFILDFFGKDVNIGLFLISLFCVVLLFCQSLFTENVRRFKSEKAAYEAYSFVLILFLLVVVVLTFLVYEYILKPNINDKNELSITYEELSPESMDKSTFFFQENSDESMGNEGGGGGAEDPENILAFILKLISALLILAVFYLIYRVVRYKLWVRKTLRSSNNEMIRRIYLYILNSLTLVGLRKKYGQTPFEYLEGFDYDKFNFSESGFRILTNTFVSTYYGKHEASDSECRVCIDLFRSVSKCAREALGTKKYMFNYLTKCYCSHPNREHSKNIRNK